MQLDPEAAAVVGVATSLATAAINYGIMREKIRRVELDIELLRKDQSVEREKFVTYQHFDAVVEPLRRALESVQRDIKEILRAVSTHDKA